ncbi:helicase associated domain-containing protein, partial [Ohtaekwangia sp.]
KFQELVTFKKKFGHLQIPTTTTEYRPLHTWAKHQREAYHAGSISKDRYDLLDGIGFNWNPPTGRRKLKK